MDEDSPPLAPPPTIRDTEPVPDPVLEALERIERNIANLSLVVNENSNKTDAAIAEARAAHAAAVCAQDTGSKIVTMLREEVMGALAEIDRKVDEGLTATKGIAGAISEDVSGLKHSIEAARKVADAALESHDAAARPVSIAARAR